MGERLNQEVQAADEATPCLKLCIRCKVLQDINQFTIKRSKADGRESHCRTCAGKRRIELNEQRKKQDKYRYELRAKRIARERRERYKEHAVELALKRYVSRAIAGKRVCVSRSKWNPDGLPLIELIKRYEELTGEKL